MRILLVADIHANWPALQAVVSEPHDLCLCLGDLVDYALDPLPCVDWVRRNAHVTVRGNHDHGVAQNVIVNGKNGFKFLTGVTRVLTRERLGRDDIRYLGRLPVTRMLSIDDTRFLLAHASPRDPLDEYAPADPDFWVRRLQNIEADVVCVGHTHHPYVLEAGDKLVINPGSVGQPRDGDPSAPRTPSSRTSNVELESLPSSIPSRKPSPSSRPASLSDVVKRIPGRGVPQRAVDTTEQWTESSH